MSDIPPTNMKIEDLRARLRLDPKSRLFYPLAEELRKNRNFDEAEKVLRDGLDHHSAYLSAWMGLGRVLIEKGNHREATEALMKAQAIDPGNVVCAKLLASSYLALGEKLEALKKLKLVRALLPADEEVDEQIEALEAEMDGRAPSAPTAAAGEKSPPSEPLAATPPGPAAESAPSTETTGSESAAEVETGAAEVPLMEEESAPRDEAVADRDEASGPGGETAPPDSREEGTSGEYPFAAAPGQEPEFVPLPETIVEPATPPLDENEPFGEVDDEGPSPTDEDGDSSDQGGSAAPPATVTMAELYEQQGHSEAARGIYEQILSADPTHDVARTRMDAMESEGAPVTGSGGARPRAAKVERLEKWLRKVDRQ
ncbi:MAG TPA: tetratricopeptide repeat protein [Thermoanaerobaculia bacterium]|nr:tetratricopeptide repeat protein [Thermoanaerobaculia bacterium]